MRRVGRSFITSATSSFQQSPTCGNRPTGTTSWHHLLTPTTSWRAPIAKRIDVALGARETIRWRPVCLRDGIGRPIVRAIGKVFVRGVQEPGTAFVLQPPSSCKICLANRRGVTLFMVRAAETDRQKAKGQTKNRRQTNGKQRSTKGSQRELGLKNVRDGCLGQANARHTPRWPQPVRDVPTKTSIETKRTRRFVETVSGFVEAVSHNRNSDVQTIRERRHELAPPPLGRDSRCVHIGIQCPTRGGNPHRPGCNTRPTLLGTCKLDSRIFDS